MTIVRLSELCAIRSGGTPSRSNPAFYGGQIPWAKISDIEASDGVVSETEETISQEGLAAIRGRTFPRGTLLFAIYGSIGKMAFAGRELSTNQAILGIENEKPDSLCERYLFRYLESRRDALLSDGAGIAQKNLSAGYVRDLEISLPPLDEQKRISAILDQADELRRKRQRALDRLNQLGQAIFHEMFGDDVQIDWDEDTVAGLVDHNAGGIRTGPFGSQLLHEEFVDEGIAVLGIDNAVANEFRWGQRRFITPEKYRSLQRYRVYPGDVIITIMGTCGRCAIVPDEIPEAINTKHLCCISLRKERCLPEYLQAYFLNHPEAKKYLRATAKGAIMDGLNMGIIKAMPVKLPPIELQRRFVQVSSALRSQRDLASHDKGTTEQLFASLQHRAFRGEL